MKKKDRPTLLSPEFWQQLVYNKQGTTLVEASMIFPLVIAGVLAVIYIVMGLYDSILLQANFHLYLRDQSGKCSATIYRNEKEVDYDLSHGFHELRPIVTGEESQSLKTSNLFTQNIQRAEKGRAYVIDEAEFVRRIHLVKEVL